jgi:hypothetical protein
MSYETNRDDGYRTQRQLHQKQQQRQQQQLQQQQRPFATPGAELPEKQNQSKHNPITELSKDAPHNGDQQ